MKRMDRLLIIGLLLAAGLSALFISLFMPPAEPLWVDISLEGSLWKRVPLAPAEIWVETEKGVNLIVVEPDGVHIAESDCPGQVCLHTGKITAGGGWIACLPHGLLITLRGETRGDLDAVAR